MLYGVAGLAPHGSKPDNFGAMVDARACQRSKAATRLFFFDQASILVIGIMGDIAERIGMAGKEPSTRIAKLCGLIARVGDTDQKAIGVEVQDCTLAVGSDNSTRGAVGQMFDMGDVTIAVFYNCETSRIVVREAPQKGAGQRIESPNVLPLSAEDIELAGILSGERDLMDLRTDWLISLCGIYRLVRTHHFGSCLTGCELAPPPISKVEYLPDMVVGMMYVQIPPAQSH